jgi:hypothetical protein
VPTRPSATPYIAGGSVLSVMNARDAAILDYTDASTGEAVLATTQTGNFTLTLAMKGQVVPVSSASAVAVTVPPNSSVAFPVGSWVEVDRMGAGTVTLTAGSGVTFRTAASALTLRAQYSTAMLRKIATDEWLIVGDLG